MNKKQKPILKNQRNVSSIHPLLLIFSLSTFLLSFYYLFPFSLTFSNSDILVVDHTDLLPATTCGHSVYIYELPPEFNSGLLRDCTKLNIYMNMCPHVANRGLGQPLSAAANWFATHQFISEMIFHARLENHPCRNFNPATASLFYVPFYGGLYASSVFREPNITARDELAVRLVDFLVKQPTWQTNYGKDHFLALGRTAWDFMRSQSGSDFGANCLLNLPPVKNMSVLTVERQPWNGQNQFGIPYSSYFHPSTTAEMTTWQHEMETSHRPYLFSFIGGPRKGLEKAAIRDELISQCNASTRCHLMKCGGKGSKCHHPMEVVKVMSMSEFCLQAPGDSFTRRSTFDSVLAGCIPVFVSPHTAYTQYKWYFPEDRSEYSIYIDEKGLNERKKVIEKELMKITRDKVVKMRSKIIELIPRITYAHPNASFVGFEDAVDVALNALANHVQSSLLPI